MAYDPWSNKLPVFGLSDWKIFALAKNTMTIRKREEQRIEGKPTMCCIEDCGIFIQLEYVRKVDPRTHEVIVEYWYDPAEIKGEVRCGFCKRAKRYVGYSRFD